MVCYIRKIVVVVINRDLLLVYNITLLVMSDTNQRDGYYGKLNVESVGSFDRQGGLLPIRKMKSRYATYYLV